MKINPHPYAPQYSQADPLVRPMGRNGSVASHHYLASEAGLEILRKGGNAVDAAVATSAALGVVEPAMDGAAGNGNMLVYRAEEDRTYCLDFSGHAPMGARDAAPDDVYFSARAQLVPGNVSGWLTALERFGTMDRETVFAPAIRYAEEGQPVSPTLSYYVRRMLTQLQGAESGVARIFAPGGRAPEPGDMLRQPELAETYRVIVRGGADEFYRGALAQRIGAYVRDHDGWLTTEDLASKLTADGIKSAPYHAGLTPTERSANQEAFLREAIEREAGDAIAVIEPSEAVARQVKRVLSDRRLRNARAEGGEVLYLCSGDDDALAALRRKLEAGSEMREAGSR